MPSGHQSADTEYRGRITQAGDARWRWVAAAPGLMTRSRADGARNRWGKRIERRQGAAKVAVARTLAMILPRSWLTNPPFEAQPAA